MLNLLTPERTIYSLRKLTATQNVRALFAMGAKDGIEALLLVWLREFAESLVQEYAEVSPTKLRAPSTTKACTTSHADLRNTFGCLPC